jgi:D-aminopeptidase
VGHSPVLGHRVTIAGLVLANFGRQADLRVYGCPVGRYLSETSSHTSEGMQGRDQSRADASHGGTGGSVIVVLATDAPLTSRQLTRVARRAAAGLARTGSAYSHGSGDFVLAFSTARSYPPHLADEGELMNPLFAATADVTEEAVIRALLAGTAMTGRDGHRVEPLTEADLQRSWEAWRQASDEWLSGR